MLVLGEKYNFTQLELEELQKKFTSIIILPYKDIEQENVLQQLQKAFEKHEEQLLVLNTEMRVGEKVIQYLTKLQFQKHKKLEVIRIEHFMEQYLYKCYIPDDNTELNFLEDIKPYSRWQLIQKRFVDFFGIIVIILFSIPIIFYAYFRIQKESPGSFIFKQSRIGMNRKEFICYKLRTMYLDAEKNGAQFASQNDKRIFPFGEIMRKMRIDELPQVVNILKGEMHLIGPRPERAVWTDKFEEEIPYYNERHLVRPGITGWAQVMYPYGSNSEDARQKLMYDLYYIKHWSLWLECNVIIKTMPVILGKEGI